MQFQAFVTPEPMLVDTARRVNAPGYAPPLVITNEHYRFSVAAVFKKAKLPLGSILLEPDPRSTAPAAAVASHFALRKAGPDVVLLIMSADHSIDCPEAFRRAVEEGLGAANEGMLVTFGIKPSKPETNYGYVKIKTGSLRDGEVLSVEHFFEKPSREMAGRFCAEPAYFWNSGMFLFKASAYIAELERFEPGMVHKALAAVESASVDLDFIRLGGDFLDCRSDSIDYAVMEKTDKAGLVPLDAGWSDIGTWDTLFDAAAKDDRSNAAWGGVLLKNVSGCYVRAESGMVAVSGVDDVIVVSTKDATLVLKRGEAAAVKDVVQDLANRRRNEVEEHLTVYRPWGHYEKLHLSERYQVKQICAAGRTAVAPTPPSPGRTLDRR